jgi:NitT/TauT family transport system substrate-binding protein
VGINKIAAVTDIYLAQQLGYFKDEGLEIEMVTGNSGNDLMTALQSGKLDIVLAIPGVAMQAREKGFNVGLVLQNEIAHDSGPDTGGLIVKGDSTIQSLADLKGKRVAVPALGNQVTVSVQHVLKKNGIEPASVQWVEIPFPQMNSVLAQGQADAIAQVDPFTSQLIASKEGRLLSWYYIDAVPGMPIGALWATDDWRKSNPDVVNKFTRAMVRSVEYLKAHPSEGKQHVAEFTGLKPEAIASMAPIVWEPKVNRAVWERVGAMMLEMGAINKAPNIDELVPAAALDPAAAR